MHRGHRRNKKLDRADLRAIGRSESLCHATRIAVAEPVVASASAPSVNPSVAPPVSPPGISAVPPWVSAVNPDRQPGWGVNPGLRSYDLPLPSQPPGLQLLPSKVPVPTKVLPLPSNAPTDSTKASANVVAANRVIKVMRVQFVSISPDRRTSVQYITDGQKKPEGPGYRPVKNERIAL